MRSTEWSKEATEKGLPKQWLAHKSKVVDIVFSPENKDIMILQQHDTFTLIDLLEVRFLDDMNRCFLYISSSSY